MTLGDLLFIGAFIVLPLAIVVWGVTMLRATRRRGAVSRPLSDIPSIPIGGTEELPAVATATDDPPDTADATAELFSPPRRDWATTVQPLRNRAAGDASSEATILLPLQAPARRYYPPIYRGRSAGAVLRMTPPAARWPSAHRRVARDRVLVR